MDFFQAQDTARRKTLWLAFLFFAAVISLVVLTNILVAFVYLWTNNTVTAGSISIADVFSLLPTEYWFWISSGVVGVITTASIFKYLVVRGGGRSIAESLGGTLILQNTTDTGERRLLNVVEEMAIAGGLPVPPVYLINEPSINAFAAGFGIDDAVIGINRGTVDQLTRDELQGVVGHEFSHILNGDTGINLRLIAILHGILFIGIIGYGILRIGGVSRRGNNGMPILALGFGLLVIGYAGTFFGNLIKAAVSRQREYLADAASVQFTRNPHGIADALKKIGGFSAGSTMSSASANEVSHMFFGQASKLFLNSIMSTHPPLDSRIRAIEPRWDGDFPLVTPAAESSMADLPETAAGFGGHTSLIQGLASHDSTIDIEPSVLTSEIGQPSKQSLDNALAIIDSTAMELREAAHDPWASRGLIYAMLLDSDETVRNRQLDHIDDRAEPGVPDQVRRLHPLVLDTDALHRVTLVEMAMPALKELSESQYQRFMSNTVVLIKADRKIDLHEWVLHRILVKELTPHFEGPQRIRARYRSIGSVAEHALGLLSVIAVHGHTETSQMQHAFEQGIRELEITGELDTSPDDNFVRLTKSLRRLRLLKPLSKPKLLKACAAVALADKHLSTEEGALLHGIAATLDCPLPPSIYG
ncbi:MAG: M48 family metallopeptidase [Gammaproteobacteria bacterium]|nr:M48 family metallopeptidase [Gammaproteobacteria bacterium]